MMNIICIRTFGNLNLIFFLFITFFAKLTLALTSDFLSPTQGWQPIISQEHKGEQKLLKINNKHKNEKIFLYWMGPHSETRAQQHSEREEITIVQGSLFWLNEDKSLQKTLTIGDYVDRKSQVKHGPFKAGPRGCLMLVRFYKSHSIDGKS